MKKIIGTCIADVDRYPFDCFSISHLVSGIISYYISFFLFCFFMDELSAVFLSYVVALVGGLAWEFIENINLVDMKRNKRADSPVNSLMDVLLVFFGSIIGVYTYGFWASNWIVNVIILGALFVLYGIARILTEKR